MGKLFTPTLNAGDMGVIVDPEDITHGSFVLIGMTDDQHVHACFPDELETVEEDGWIPYKREQVARVFFFRLSWAEVIGVAGGKTLKISEQTGVIPPIVSGIAPSERERLRALLGDREEAWVTGIFTDGGIAFGQNEVDPPDEEVTFRPVVEVDWT